MRADALDDVARGAEVLQRLEPAIEDRLGRAIPFHVEAQRLAASGIVVQIHGQPVSCGRGVEVLREIGARAEQSLLLAAPQRRPDGAPRRGAERAEDAHRLHDGHRAIRVVGGAAGRVPRVEMRANEHDLVAQRRVLSRDLGDDVVAVPVVLEIARPELDAQRHRASLRGQAREHVVLFAGDDDRGHRVGGVARLPVTPTVPSRYALGLSATAAPARLQQRHQFVDRRRAARLRQGRVARWPPGDRRDPAAAGRASTNSVCGRCVSTMAPRSCAAMAWICAAVLSPT